MDNSGLVLVVSPDAQTVVRQGDLLFASEAVGEGQTYIVVQQSNASAAPQPAPQGPVVQADKGAKPVGGGGVRMSFTTKHPDDLGEPFEIIVSSTISSQGLEHLVSMTPAGKYCTVQLDLNAPALDLFDV
jgi:hypothetical protein